VATFDLWNDPKQRADRYLTDEVHPNDKPYILLWASYTTDNGVQLRELFAISGDNMLLTKYHWPYRKTKAPKIKLIIDYYHVTLKKPYTEYKTPQEFKTAIRKWLQADNGTI
jgi:hypothetical protein